MGTSRTLEFWSRYAKTFDDFYDSTSLVDRLFRKSIQLREQRAIDLVRALDAPTVLDLGCGPGRQVTAAVDAGASLAVGVDGAENMIEIARQAIDELGLEEKVEVHLSDFFAYEDDRTYDIVWALGVFDYVADPDRLLQLMKSRCRGTVAASFRRRWVVRYPARKALYVLRGSPVYFYGKGELRRLFERNGLNDIQVDKIDRALYFVTATV